MPLRRPAAHPLPAHISMPCPTCAEEGGAMVYDPSDYAGVRGTWQGCPECAASGRITLYLGLHEGALYGFIEESQTLGIFETVSDAHELNWLHSWRANPRRWEDVFVLEALEVQI